MRTRAGRELVMVAAHPLVASCARGLRSGGGLARRGRESRRPASWSTPAGARSARVTLANAPGWNEHVIRVPADAVGEGETALELRGRYAAFHYWFYQ